MKPVITRQKLPPIGQLLRHSLKTLRRQTPSEFWQGATAVSQHYKATVDAARLQKYKHMFNGLLAEVPLNYYYLLAQRAHLHVCTQKNYPYPVLGMVHCSNEISCYQTPESDLPLDLDVSVIGSEIDQRNNIRLTFKVDFLQQGQLLVCCMSEYLIKAQGLNGGGVGVKAKSSANHNMPSVDKISATQQYKANMGIKYARVSGDFNPIHLYRFSAKLFGFKRPILHGMCLAACAQEFIEMNFGNPVVSMNIAFMRPVFLPSAVKIVADSEQGVLQFKSHIGNKTHAQVRFTAV
ncbi:MaoC/PaaZ C-terminal domain-containing protein [Marinicella sp. S1101]|uniref:MaoC/PaaZ C-terminal domain-containing protein n=1 Tax=Marinicella marina TaxID=2996016 RepID=UPI0022608697|nr:MaoC/PaaZ C-terminal domain-containing protein [Marinicella marina]MCX7554050.1 MaoC/PaaZ C-terminal domain-containing protein [Marinicella marina]MDJ1140542.1 MaoC/PaaZ C-terminal domain-containing protein [Marinicella marina]